jgi:cell division protein FtsN
MNTASITHHPVSMVTAATAAAAVVAAIAFTAVAGSHESDSASPTPSSQSRSIAPGHHYPPEHGGTVMIGQP